IAARPDADDAASRQRLAMREVVRQVEGVSHTRGQLRLRQRDEVVEPALEDAKREIEVTRVATPSANVLADVPTTRVPVRHERATASAFCAPTPMIPSSKSRPCF